MALRLFKLLSSWASERPAKNGVTQAARRSQQFARAEAALQSKELELAVRLFSELIENKPDDAEAYYKRGNAHNGLGLDQLALLDYDNAVALRASYAQAWCNRGTILERMTHWDQALDSYARAIELAPDDYLSYYNRASVLRKLKQFDVALQNYDRVLELKGNYLQAHINRAHLLHQLRHYEAAVAGYTNALHLNPCMAEAYHGRGLSLASLNRNSEALGDCTQAVTLKNNFVEAYVSRGNVLQELRQFTTAIASYNKALELNTTADGAAVPSMVYAEAFQGRGSCEFRIGQFAASIDSYDLALVTEPCHKYLLGLRRFMLMSCCSWEDMEKDVGLLDAGLRSEQAVTVPFVALAILDSPKLHRMAAQKWVSEECAPDAALGLVPEPVRHTRIRIGYFSADFRSHAVALLSAALFETHDRSKFEVTAFAFGPVVVGDPMRVRLEKAFERFIDVRENSDAHVALQARELGIDIAVDLTGFTDYSRTNIFALRAAPIQVNYLGYAGTMAAPYMDYLIADRTVIPPSQQKYYSEKIIYLPNSYLPNDTSREIADNVFTREELGLPTVGFVFCCFNNNYKIMPDTFDSWMRILARSSNSVLWLSCANALTANNLRCEATKRGIDARRLVFAERIDSQPLHLARLRSAGLFLDTLPYNAHATAIDALWAGLPLLTRVGQTFPGRVAASLLKTINLPQLITETAQQYEDAAVRLSADTGELASIRAQLEQNRRTSKLFDGDQFVRDLESAYAQMYERHLSERP